MLLIDCESNLSMVRCKLEDVDSWGEKLQAWTLSNPSRLTAVNTLTPVQSPQSSSDGTGRDRWLWIIIRHKVTPSNMADGRIWSGGQGTAVYTRPEENRQKLSHYLSHKVLLVTTTGRLQCFLDAEPSAGGVVTQQLQCGFFVECEWVEDMIPCNVIKHGLWMIWTDCHSYVVWWSAAGYRCIFVACF